MMTALSCGNISPAPPEPLLSHVLWSRHCCNSDAYHNIRLPYLVYRIECFLGQEIGGGSLVSACMVVELSV